MPTDFGVNRMLWLQRWKRKKLLLLLLPLPLLAIQ